MYHLLEISAIILCDSEKWCWLLFVTHIRMCQYGDKERLSTRNFTITKFYHAKRCFYSI